MLNETVDNLKQNYSVIDTIYLSDYLKNNNRWLFQKLESAYRSAYTEQERILFVQDCADIHEYENFPSLAILTLQKYASQIDISNSFILVVSTDDRVIDELEKARLLYSTTTVPIQHLIVSGPKFKSDPVYPADTFCVFPWNHLYVGPDGNVLPCCNADRNFPMGNIQTSSVIDIIKSDQFNQLRANMLKGKRSKECNGCYRLEDAGLPSHRIVNNKDKMTFNPNDVNTDGTIDVFKPIFLDIRLNNICNLKCRMCSSYYSSSIGQEEFEMWGRLPKTSTMLKSHQRTDSLQEILDYVPYTQKIYFAGGEPLLAVEHYEILNKLISLGHTDLKIAYSTNFTNLYYKNQPVTDWWKHFTNIEIGASLDAHGDVAGYIRHGTVWSVIEQNLDFLKKQCPNINFTVTSTVGFLNISSLIERQQTWHEINRLPITKFSLNVLTHPEHLSATVLPAHHKNRLDALIKKHIEWCNKNSANTLATQWQSVLTYMWSRDNRHLLADFKRLTLIMDSNRNESFKKIFPEYEDLIDTD